MTHEFLQIIKGLSGFFQQLPCNSKPGAVKQGINHRWILVVETTLGKNNAFFFKKLATDTPSPPNLIIIIAHVVGQGSELHNYVIKISVKYFSHYSWKRTH